MAIDKFIPQVWSAKLLLELRKSLVYGQPGVINRDYEGDIAEAGDMVRVNSFGPVSVFDYEKNQDMPGPETLTDEEAVLQITQSKAFNFQIDDIDRAQQQPKIMAEAMADAAYRLADVADRYIAGMHGEAGLLIGDDASPVTPGVGDAYELLVDMGTLLTESNNARGAGERWVVVPPWFYALLLKDERFAGTGGTGAENTLYNGQVGSAAGFAVLESNNVPNDGGERYKILAGTSQAWSYAEQINQVEAYRPERRFGDAMKGLHLYGAKVFRPQSLVCVTADRP